ncbi:MAG TPA: hypothetical protein VG096_11280 [Bryobacteraceae bacterium]|jgi:Flp pilus assembly pilin Flp|nr:hypothetical protein [Bryobacteraceae bacterium]
MKDMLIGFLAGVTFGVVMCGAGNLLGGSLAFVWEHLTAALGR